MTCGLPGWFTDVPLQYVRREETMTNETGQTRRIVLGGLAASAGSLSMIDETTAQAQASGKTFVLVHGAWHGGWCWRRVSDLLEKKGHKVFSPTMTGLGERSHLLDAKINLATHVTDIVNVIKWESLNDIVLVGHSYAGIIISGVAEELREAIGSIVFLDAFVPENGDNLAAKASQPVRESIAAAVEKGETVMKPVSAAVFRVNEKDRGWVDAMCTPHPLATFTDKITITGARERIAKKAYIRAKGYPSIPFDSAQERLKATDSWRIYEVPCGHDVMVDMPERLTEILLEVA
jgi:pimeloyl-ACP methyl ester carboxylesterase